MCFAGAWEWEHLQEALEEKLKNSLAVAQLMDCIRSLIGRERVKSLTLIIASCLLFNCLPQKVNGAARSRTEKRLNFNVFHNLWIYLLICTSKVHTSDACGQKKVS